SLPARSLFSSLGFLVWLDSLFCHTNGNHRGGVLGLRSFLWSALARDFRESIPHTPSPRFHPLCSFAFDSPTAVNCRYRAPYIWQQFGIELREIHPEHLHHRKDHCARWPDRSGNLLWSQCGGNLCKLRDGLASDGD